MAATELKAFCVWQFVKSEYVILVQCVFHLKFNFDSNDWPEFRKRIEVAIAPMIPD